MGKGEGGYVDYKYIVVSIVKSPHPSPQSPNGDVIEFSSSGKEDGRQTYSNGRLQQELSYEYEYHDNGSIKTKKSYKNNVEVGTWTTWFENGNTKEEGKWKNGEYFLINRWNLNGDFLVKDGKGGWVSKNEDGTKKQKQMYEDGRLVLNLIFKQEYLGLIAILSKSSDKIGFINGLLYPNFSE